MRNVTNVVAQPTTEKEFFELACERVKRGIEWLSAYRESSERLPHDWRRRMWSVNSQGKAICRVSVSDDHLHPLALVYECKHRFADESEEVSAKRIIEYFELNNHRLLELGFAADPLDPRGVHTLNCAWKKMLLERALPNTTPRWHVGKYRKPLRREPHTATPQ